MPTHQWENRTPYSAQLSMNSTQCKFLDSFWKHNALWCLRHLKRQWWTQSKFSDPVCCLPTSSQPLSPLAGSVRSRAAMDQTLTCYGNGWCLTGTEHRSGSRSDAPVHSASFWDWRKKKFFLLFVLGTPKKYRKSVSVPSWQHPAFCYTELRFDVWPAQKTHLPLKAKSVPGELDKILAGTSFHSTGL